MSKARKPWGTTEALAREPLVHADRIVVQAGGFCSIHRHGAKANVFHVLKGMLVVRQFAALGAPAYQRAIGPGESRTVSAGVWHQFWCPSECVCLEAYLPAMDGAELDAEDIERHPECLVGGLDVPGATLDGLWARAFGRMEAARR